MILYHATYKSNAEKIGKEGLRRNSPINFNGMSMEGMLYFAFNPEAAVSFIESADNYGGQEITVFAVEARDIDLSKVRYDWNNRCEYHEDIISLAYDEDVPAIMLNELTADEIAAAPDITIDDLEELDDEAYEIWDKLMTVFDEEVETNLENDPEKYMDDIEREELHEAQGWYDHDESEEIDEPEDP